MNPNSSFRDGSLCSALASAIRSESKGRTYRIMEVCGTHTMSISRSGLRSVLPDNVELVSGPGCPVCVTSQGEIDMFFSLLEKGVSLVTFGDLLRIPGSSGETLSSARAAGGDVRVVYSPLDALNIAEKEPDKKFVFLGVGFETTAPAVGFLVRRAVEEQSKNLSVLSLCKTMPAALEFLINDPDLNLDGFLCPGNVTAVTGISMYENIKLAGKAPVVAGFEPLEILDAVLEIIRQVNARDFKVVNKYRRVAPDEGNSIARGLMNDIFESVPAVWRGLGELEYSGLELREDYYWWNAREIYEIRPGPSAETAGCRCGQVLTGKIKPPRCPLFGKKCVPENPVGPCMVSSEGTCAAYYSFLR